MQEHEALLLRGWLFADLTGTIANVMATPGVTPFAEFTHTPHTPTLADDILLGADGNLLGMPSVDILAERQKKRKRRRSSNGSRAAKKSLQNNSLDDADIAALLLKKITTNINGERIEQFILFEGGISVPPLKLSEEILADILKKIQEINELDADLKKSALSKASSPTF